MDLARPWRRGWHPPLVPIAAGHASHAKQDTNEAQPTYHRNAAGGHPSIRFDGLHCCLTLEPIGTVHECLSGRPDESCFTIFLMVSSACLEGTAPWPVLSALDPKLSFSFQISADLREGEPCYLLRYGGIYRTSPPGVDIWQARLLVVRKDCCGLRWWLDGTELDDLPLTGGTGGVQAGASEGVLGLDEDSEIKVERIILGRSANEIHGAIPGHKHHHFFDGDVAELLVYRVALNRGHVDEVCTYFSIKFRRHLTLQWRSPESLGTSATQPPPSWTDVKAIVASIQETGPETISHLQELLAWSWTEQGCHAIVEHMEVCA